MYYLQYSILVLGVILLNFNLIVFDHVWLFFSTNNLKNKNLNARKLLFV